MSQGQVYVPPIAKKVTREDNSNGSSGYDQNGYYIHWDQRWGITNKTWACIEAYLSYTGWPTLASRYNVDASYKNFLSYVEGTLVNKDGESIQFQGNLDEVFGMWDAVNKFDFVVDNASTLGRFPTGEAQNGACIEVL